MLFLLSAFFSGTETACFSLSQLQKQRMSSSPKGRRALKLLADPGVLLTSILLGNTFVNVAASSLAAGITSTLIKGPLGLIAGVFIMTFLLLVLGEITPKTLARNKNRQWLEFSVPFLYFMLRLFSPVARFLKYPADVANKIIPGKDNSDGYRSSELNVLMQMAKADGLLGDEVATAKAILDLDERYCISAMVPREKACFFMSDLTIDEMKAIAFANTHTVYPYIQVETGLMTGVVNIKDLLGRNHFTVRNVPFFPESARLSRVLIELYKSNSGIGSVVDEYGDWTGIISIEDILHRAVFAVSPKNRLPESVSRSGDGFLIPADLPIDSLNELLGLEVKSKYAESCGGLLQEITGELPQLYDVVLAERVSFKVMDVKRNTITTIYVEEVKTHD